MGGSGGAIHTGGHYTLICGGSGGYYTQYLYTSTKNMHTKVNLFVNTKAPIICYMRTHIMYYMYLEVATLYIVPYLHSFDECDVLVGESVECGQGSLQSREGLG